ncbi:site-specific integrase [soil metagenome]
MAHVERRGQRWRARYRGPDGRERNRTFDRKIDGEKWLVTVEADKLRGLWTDPRLARTTVNAWSARWLASKVDLAPRTRAGYESLLRTLVLPTFGDRPVGAVGTVDVREWQADLSRRGLSASRRRQALQVLSAAMKAAVEGGLVARSPVDPVRPPRVPRREQRFLTAGQLEALVDAADPRYATLLYLLAYGGLRWGEAAALRRKRVDVLRGRLDVAESLAEVGGRLVFGSTKTHTARTVVLPGFLADRLAGMLHGGPDTLVFTAPAGGPLRHGNWRRRVWQPALAAARLPGDLRIHDLRHTCAALLAQQGDHPKAVQRQLGHSSLQVTWDTYGHLYPDDLDALGVALDEAHQHARAASVRPGTAGGVTALPTRGGEHAV